MNVMDVRGGVVIHAEFPRNDLLEKIVEIAGGHIPLIIADPPYGQIVDRSWDLQYKDDLRFAEYMFDWTENCASICLPGASMYVWGGIGKPHFRPFYRYLADVENRTKWQLANHITWSKKRAYGVSHNYLFTREECAYLTLGDIKKPRMFNIPLLDEKRGYAGYNNKYPAKSEFLRRTNVWRDITEIMQGKVHVCQKPEKLAEIMIATHTTDGEWVLDPFAGSGSTGLAARRMGRRFVLVEQDERAVNVILDRMAGQS